MENEPDDVEGPREGDLWADPAQLLTGRQVADLLEIQPSTWRTYVMRGYAPKPDDDDSDGGRRPASRRQPRWRFDTICKYRDERRGQGARTDLAGTGE